MNYLIPANSKRGNLIFGLFRPIDLWILGGGVLLTLILLMIVTTKDGAATFVILIPALIAGLLIAPVPHYHNILVVIQETLVFITTRQRYIWKGWCVQDGETKK